MKRLYRAEATVVVYLVAADEREAEMFAAASVAEEVGENGVDRDSVLVSPVPKDHAIDEGWKHSLPRNLGPGDRIATCQKYLEASGDENNHH